MDKLYDVIILGGGPAGLTAGLYAGRGGLNALIIEKGQDGGQIALSSDVENYPGQPAPGETGVSLAERMAEQAERFGVHRCSDEIRAVDLKSDVKRLSGLNSTYQARTVIIAAGAHPRPIGRENGAHPSAPPATDRFSEDWMSMLSEAATARRRRPSI